MTYEDGKKKKSSMLAERRRDDGITSDRRRVIKRLCDVIQDKLVCDTSQGMHLQLTRH